MRLQDFLTWSKWKTEKDKFKEFIEREYSHLNWKEAFHEVAYELHQLSEKVKTMTEPKKEEPKV